MKTYIKIAYRNLIKNKVRSGILFLAIFGITFVLTMLLSLTEGVRFSMLKGATTVMSGHINISGFYKISPSSSAPMVTELAKLRKWSKENLPELDYLTDRIKCFGKLISDYETVTIPMWGIDPVEERDVLTDLRLKEGNLLDLEKSGSIAIFEIQAKRLKAKIGDTLTVSLPTSRNSYNTKDVKVVAVLTDMGMFSAFTVFLNKDDARELYQMKPDTSGQIMLFFKSLKNQAGIENFLRTELPKIGYTLMDKDPRPFWLKLESVTAENWKGQRLDITTWQDEISFLDWIIKLFDLITITLVAVLLFLAILGLMNALWMSIKERTQEIGTLRAIGMKKNEVVKMFFIESLLLASASAFTGIMATVFTATVLNFIHIPLTSDAIKMFLIADELLFIINYQTLATAFIGIVVVIGLGSLYPAFKAGKMRPITAINNVD